MAGGGDLPKPDLAEFHRTLVAAVAARLPDPLTMVDVQCRELLRRLRDAQRAALAKPNGSDANLLLEGVALRLPSPVHPVNDGRAPSGVG